MDVAITSIHVTKPQHHQWCMLQKDAYKARNSTDLHEGESFVQSLAPADGIVISC